MRIVLGAIGVSVICLSILVGVLFGRVHDQFVALNQERSRNIYAGCEETNVRHDQTIRRLHLLVEEMPPGPRRVRAVQAMAGSVALIDALAPKRDCRALVKRQVDTTP